jgi:hypothetical protein
LPSLSAEHLKKKTRLPSSLYKRLETVNKQTKIFGPTQHFSIIPYSATRFGSHELSSGSSCYSNLKNIYRNLSMQLSQILESSSGLDTLYQKICLYSNLVPSVLNSCTGWCQELDGQQQTILNWTDSKCLLVEHQVEFRISRLFYEENFKLN